MSSVVQRRAMPMHPKILAPVALEIPRPGGSTEVISRVLDLEEDVLIVIARPDLAHVADAGTLPHEDAELMLTWPDDRGQMQRSVVASASRRSYGPVWVLAPRGPAQRLQRREFLRVPMAVYVVLHVTTGESAGQSLAGTVVDIGEGGLLAAVRGEAPDPGSRIEVALRLDDQVLHPSAEVVRHVTLPGGGQGLALRFTDPGLHGDRIRKLAFAEQRRLTTGRTRA